MNSTSGLPVLALTQGDPAGIGPELLVRLVTQSTSTCRLVLVAEASALEQASALVEGAVSFRIFSSPPSRREIEELDGAEVPVLDPVGLSREIRFGVSGPADASGAIDCLDAGIGLARSGIVDALVTAPVSKQSIAQHKIPDFRGHTDYLAAACGLEHYGSEYLMTFLSDDLQVALLTTHISLRLAVEGLEQAQVVAALECLARHAGGRIALAGLNPHAGEGGLLGEEDDAILAPAVAQAQAQGIAVTGPWPADSVFARAKRGEFDWVLALYHDQGLIPVKTAGFGAATNWTLGLPLVRTSVDHGTAFEIAGRGVADVAPMRHVVEATLELLAGRLPKSAAI